MRSKAAKAIERHRATEEAMRAAFERLKRGSPIRSPIWTKVTQNNVAREAGFSPSALRKERYPDLVFEIQKYGSASPCDAPRQVRESLIEDAPTKAIDISRMLSLLAEVAELRKKVHELQTIIDDRNRFEPNRFR